MTSYKEPMVRRSGNRLITTSLAISHHFGKKHKNIIQAIEQLECSQSFRELNFKLTSYTTSQNKSLPMYEITRDGFMFLCMGFTGAAAAQWKEKYIAAFNALDEALHQQSISLDALQSELLKARPDWAEMLRYRALGLSAGEIARLIGAGRSTVSRHLRYLRGLGFAVQISPQPRQLAAARRKLVQAEESAAQMPLVL